MNEESPVLIDDMHEENIIQVIGIKITSFFFQVFLTFNPYKDLLHTTNNTSSQFFVFYGLNIMDQNLNLL